jgi:hypothetical protein
MPVMFQIEGRDDDWNNWESLIKNNINPSVNFIVFILPGGKGKGKFYNEIKRHLFTKIPVPCQVILGSTISKGKNLRSIINKVLI